MSEGFKPYSNLSKALLQSIYKAARCAFFRHQRLVEPVVSLFRQGDGIESRVETPHGVSFLTPATLPVKHRLNLPRIGKPGGYCGIAARRGWGGVSGRGREESSFIPLCVAVDRCDLWGGC